jgi:serine/threonine-protein kinase
MIRPRDQLHATPIQGSAGAETPFFSPDGQQIGALTEQRVHIAAIDGGQAITVSDTLTGVAGASWARDGFIYVDGQGQTPLARVEVKARAVPKWFTGLDTATGEVDHTWPDVLPNGKGVLFTVAFTGKNAVKAGTTFAIAVAEIPSGKHRVIVNDAKFARYAAGHLLYVTTNKTLMVVPFDQNSMQIVGKPRALVEGMRLGDLGAADLAVSETGTLVYATGAGEGKHELVWVTRDGKEQPIDPDLQGTLLSPALSPDARQLAVSIVTTAGRADIWTKQLDGGPAVNLTLDGKGNFKPTWTPDGRSLTFESAAGGTRSDLRTKRADGSANAVLQFHGKRDLFQPLWSPDGKWLIFVDVLEPGSIGIFGIRPGIDTAPVPLVASKVIQVSPTLSRDGRWLAYDSNESGIPEVYVVPFPNTGTAKWAAGGGTEPQWSRSGKELFYRDASGRLVAVEVKTRPTFSLGRSTPLFSAAGFESNQFVPQYDVSLDGRRFLMIRPIAASASDKLIVVDNWFEELKAKSRK